MWRVPSGLFSDSRNHQAFNATDVQAGVDFIAMKFESLVSNCRFTGRLGGMRRP